MRRLCALFLLLVCFGCTKASSITLQEAKDIALKEYQGEILEASKDDSNQRSVYQIKMMVEEKTYSITIDAKDGSILADSIIVPKDTTDSQTDANHSDTTKQQRSEEEIKKIALEKTEGGDVVKIEFDKADDAYETDTYDVKIIKGNMEYELAIDAYSGEILKYEEEAITK